MSGENRNYRMVNTGVLALAGCITSYMQDPSEQRLEVVERACVGLLIGNDIASGPELLSEHLHTIGAYIITKHRRHQASHTPEASQ